MHYNIRMGEYNSLFEQGKDIEVVADNTRIFYSTSPAMFPLKVSAGSSIVKLHFQVAHVPPISNDDNLYCFV